MREMENRQIMVEVSIWEPNCGLWRRNNEKPWNKWQPKHNGKHVILYKTLMRLVCFSLSQWIISLSTSWPNQKLASFLTFSFSLHLINHQFLSPQVHIPLHSLNYLSGLDHLCFLPGLLQSFLTSLLNPFQVILQISSKVILKHNLDHLSLVNPPVASGALAMKFRLLSMDYTSSS